MDTGYHEHVFERVLTNASIIRNKVLRSSQSTVKILSMPYVINRGSSSFI